MWHLLCKSVFYLSGSVFTPTMGLSLLKTLLATRSIVPSPKHKYRYIYIYNIDIKAQVCTSTFVKTHKPPAEMMASAHRTTSSSYSPLFTTFTSVPLLLKTHKSSPFWKKDVPYSSLLKLVEVSPVSAAVQCTLHVKKPRKATANTKKKKRFYPCKAHVLLKEFILLEEEQGVLNSMLCCVTS